MKTIILKNLVKNSSSNDQGVILFNVLKLAYLNNDLFILEVDNNLALSSSFLNTSIGCFLDNYGKTGLRSTIKFKGSKSQFLRISEYIHKYENVYLS